MHLAMSTLLVNDSQNKKEALKRFKLTDPFQFLALGFGSGLAPKVPGTFGTVAAIPVYLAMVLLSPLNYILVAILMTFVGIFLCGYTAKAVNVHDHPAIVWDEIVGFVITMFLIPLSWENILLGFALFRFFDIVKPWPISFIDKKIHGGFGIMLDDVIAGFMALACMHIII